MKAKLKKCIIIIRLLKHGAELSRRDICKVLQKEFPDDQEMSRNTFSSYIEFIEDILPCRIIYDVKTNKYRLRVNKTIPTEVNQMFDYLINQYDIELALPLLVKHSTKIHNAEIITGTENLGIILKAIEEHRGYSCDYRSFKNGTNKHRTFIPLFVTSWEGRWYVVSESTTHPDGMPYTYALERMDNIELTEENMEPNSFVTIDEYFKDSYGIQHYNPKEKACDIKIQVFGSEVEYIRARPIHQSQKIIEEGDGYMIIRLHLTPCYNFYQRLMWLREGIKVLEPQSVINELLKINSKVSELYHTNE